MVEPAQHPAITREQSRQVVHPRDGEHGDQADAVDDDRRARVAPPGARAASTHGEEDRHGYRSPVEGAPQRRPQRRHLA